jgi:hypothetical protein
MLSNLPPVSVLQFSVYGPFIDSNFFFFISHPLISGLCPSSLQVMVSFLITYFYPSWLTVSLLVVTGWVFYPFCLLYWGRAVYMIDFVSP